MTDDLYTMAFTVKTIMITTIHRWWSLCLFMTMWSINGWTSILWCSLFLDKPLDGDHYVDPYCDHKNSIHLKQGSQFFVTTILKGPKRWVNNLNRQLMQRWVATNTVFFTCFNNHPTVLLGRSNGLSAFSHGCPYFANASNNDKKHDN
jgi:hypothetical protein